MTYHLKDFGSYTAGGRQHRVTKGAVRAVQFTRDTSHAYDPKGTFAVEHVYVQYFVPEHRNSEPPVVLVHGGGMHGSTWDKSPDGRAGWLHLLLARGYEVHVLDNVERGRSGFMPGLWDGEPILRSIEEAWTLFRFGTRGGFRTRTPFPHQKFPVEHLDKFAQHFVPRWLTTTPLHVAGLISVLERTGPAIVICHSQGGEITFDAQAKIPSLIKAIIAVEPSTAECDLITMQECPLVLMKGDHMDEDPDTAERARRWVALIDNLTNLGGRARLLDTVSEIAPGGSHMLMMDQHSKECLDVALQMLSDVMPTAQVKPLSK